MIRAILFDKDGTLTDYRATWEPFIADMIRALSRDSGVEGETIAARIGFDLTEDSLLSHSPVVTAPEHVTFDLILAAVGWTRPALQGWFDARPKDVPQVWVPGLHETLAELRDAGLRLGVLTNATEAGALSHLSHVGALDHFDRVIGCDSGFGAKPDPRGAADFADALGIARSEVLLVGDGMPDMNAAKGAGLGAVGVLTGTLAEADLAPHAEAVLPDISHLAGWLAQRPAVPAQ